MREGRGEGFVLEIRIQCLVMEGEAVFYEEHEGEGRRGKI